MRTIAIHRSIGAQAHPPPFWFHYDYHEKFTIYFARVLRFKAAAIFATLAAFETGAEMTHEPCVLQAGCLLFQTSGSFKETIYMALLQKTDLEFKYNWTAISPDDPRITGSLDSTVLNRGEGYEMLAFINRFAVANEWRQKVSGLKVERLINKHLPDDIRSHAKIKKWLADNWKKYE